MHVWSELWNALGDWRDDDDGAKLEKRWDHQESNTSSIRIALDRYSNCEISKWRSPVIVRSMLGDWFTSVDLVLPAGAKSSSERAALAPRRPLEHGCAGTWVPIGFNWSRWSGPRSAAAAVCVPRTIQSALSESHARCQSPR